MSHATLRRLSACLAIAALLLFVAVLANTLGRGEREETELASGHWFERIARRPFSEVDYARGQLDYDLRDLHREMAVRSKIQAFDLLLNTQEFWYDLDSSGTTLPNEWIALRRLLREEMAREIFLDLIKRAGPPGRVYGMCGLLVADKDEFRKGQRTYEKDQSLVLVMSADFGSMYPISSIVRIDGAVIIGDPIDAAAYNRVMILGSGICDVIGGGLSGRIINAKPHYP